MREVCEREEERGRGDGRLTILMSIQLLEVTVRSLKKSGASER